MPPWGANFLHPPRAEPGAPPGLHVQQVVWLRAHLYRAQRRIRLRAVFSVEMATGKGIVAGCSFETFYAATQRILRVAAPSHLP